MQHTQLAAALLAALSANALANTPPQLPPAEFTLEEIVVTATRIPTAVRDSLSDVTVVERALIEQQDHLSLPDLLSSLPGIQVTTNGGRGATSTLSLRGGNAGHTAVLIDGLRISSATSGTTAIQAIPLGQIDRIEVVRGPVSSLYGTDAMTGVVQLFTPEGFGKPAPTAHLGAGSHGTTIASVGYGGEVGATRFNFLAGLEQSEGFSTIRESKAGLFDMYNPDDDAWSSQNISAKISHRVSNELKIGAAVFYSRGMKHYDNSNCDSSYTICSTAYDNRNLQKLQSLHAHAEYRVNAIWDTRLRLGQSLDLQKNWLQNPLTSVVTIDQYQTRENQAIWQNDIKALGGLFTLTREIRDLDVSSSKSFVVSEQETNSVSLGYQGRFGKHSVQASVRHDNISRQGGHDSEFLGYGYRLAPAWSARMGYGTAFHAPTFNDLYWPLDPVNYFEGNPNLKPEKARNREIGLSYDISGVHAGFTAYHNKISNLIDYREGSAPSYIGTMANVNTATLKGLTLEYAVRSGIWSWKGGVDYLSAKNDANGRTLQRRAPRTGNFELRRDLGRYDLGARLHAVSGRFNDHENTQKLSGYTTIDIDASYSIAPGWKLEARVDNLFDRDYTSVRSTLTPYNDFSVPGRVVFVGLRYQPAK